MLENGFLPYQGNVRAYTLLSVKQFLTQKRNTVLDHPSHSPDLTPCECVGATKEFIEGDVIIMYAFFFK